MGLRIVFRRLEQKDPKGLKPALQLRAGKLFHRVETSRGKRLVVGTSDDGFLDPNELVVLAAVDLLPHLEEVVDRITSVGRIKHILADLVRAVWYVGREATRALLQVHLHSQA